MKRNIKPKKEKITTVEQLIDLDCEILLKQTNEKEKRQYRKIDIYVFLTQFSKIEQCIQQTNSHCDMSIKLSAQKHIYTRIKEELFKILENIIQENNEKGISVEETLEEMKQDDYIKSKLGFDYTLKDKKQMKKVLENLRKYIDEYVESKQKVNGLEEVKKEEIIIQARKKEKTKKQGQTTFFEKVAKHTQQFSFLVEGLERYQNLNGYVQTQRFTNMEDYFRFKAIQDEIKEKMCKASISEEKAIEAILKREDENDEEKVKILSSRLEVIQRKNRDR